MSGFISMCSFCFYVGVSLTGQFPKPTTTSHQPQPYHTSPPSSSPSCPLPSPITNHISNLMPAFSANTRYMDMTYGNMGKDGNVKTLPLFGDTNV